jgi:hypothetical protein
MYKLITGLKSSSGNGFFSAIAIGIAVFFIVSCGNGEKKKEALDHVDKLMQQFAPVVINNDYFDSLYGAYENAEVTRMQKFTPQTVRNFHPDNASLLKMAILLDSFAASGKIAIEQIRHLPRTSGSAVYDSCAVTYLGAIINRQTGASAMFKDSTRNGLSDAKMMFTLEDNLVQALVEWDKAKENYYSECAIDSKDLDEICTRVRLRGHSNLLYAR